MPDDVGDADDRVTVAVSNSVVAAGDVPLAGNLPQGQWQCDTATIDRPVDMTGITRGATVIDRYYTTYGELSLFVDELCRLIMGPYRLVPGHRLLGRFAVGVVVKVCECT